MWPVQTLTLLLCLTEEEQLFAWDRTPELPVPPAVEVVLPDPADEAEAEEDVIAFPVVG